MKRAQKRFADDKKLHLSLLLYKNFNQKPE